MLYKRFLAFFLCCFFVFTSISFAKITLLYRSDIWSSNVNDQTDQYNLNGTQNNIRLSLILTPKQPAVLQLVLPQMGYRFVDKDVATLQIDQTQYNLSKEVTGQNTKTTLFQYRLNHIELISFIHEITSKGEGVVLINQRGIPISFSGTSMAVTAILKDIHHRHIVSLPAPFNGNGAKIEDSPILIMKQHIIEWLNGFPDILFQGNLLNYFMYIVILFLFYKVVFKIFIVRIYRYVQRRKAKKLCFKEIKEQASKLRIRREQLLYRDEYGSVVFDKWNKEVTKFINSRIIPLLSYYKLERYYSDIAKSVQKYIHKTAKTSQKRNQKKGNAYHPDMDAYDYERLCAQKLCEMGWKAKATQASGDQGADVIAIKDGITVVLQCKLYSKPVGNSAVQQINAAKIYYHAQYAAVVSNATYTVSARQLASSINVSLLHHDEIQDYVRFLLGQQ